MKKLFTLLGIVVGISGFTQGTIGNQGFESWSDIVVKDSIQGWTTSTQENQGQGIDIVNTYQNTPGYAGTYSVKMETVLWWNEGSMQNDTLFGYCIRMNADGGNFTGFPYTDTVDTFTGWYKCDVQTGDTAVAIIELSKSGVVYSQSIYKFYGSQSSWTLFSFPLMNGATEEPDSVWVGFASSDPFTPGVATPGSWLEIDEVAFEFNSGSMTTPAPIPDNSFENLIQETIEQPDDWFTFDPFVYNAFGTLAVTKSTDASEGSYSMQIENTFDYSTNGIPALVTNGYFNLGSSMIMGGSPFTAQPTQVSGQYKYTPSLTDTAFVFLEMWNGTSGMLVQQFDTLFSAATWTPWSIDLALTEAPDSVRVTMFAGNNFGSVLLIDDLQFTGGDVSVDELYVGDDWSYYPNPTSDIVTIVFDEANTIEIIDITGKTVYTEASPNSNSVSISTAEWQSGVYFIRINRNGNVDSKKLIVRH